MSASTIAALATAASLLAAPSAVHEPPRAGKAPAVTSQEVQCSYDGTNLHLVGSARVTKTVVNDRVSLTVDSYRIALNGAPGGNNANVISQVRSGSRSNSAEFDKGIQDARWHDLGLTATLDSVGSSAETSVRFIFDRSIVSDPSCTVRV